MLIGRLIEINYFEEMKHWFLSNAVSLDDMCFCDSQHSTYRMLYITEYSSSID